MTAFELLSRLRSRAIRLWVEGEQLRYSAPAGALTPELRAELVARKAELLAFLGETSADASATSIRPAPRSGALPLSFAQQRLWFIDQLAPGNSGYHIPIALRLSGQLDLAVLQHGLDAVVARHESLRTTFATVAGQPVQVIALSASIPLQFVDLRQLPATAHDRALQQCGAEEVQRPFDLTSGPLLRVVLLRLGDDEHIALVTIHHIVTDLWSMTLLTQELAALYTAAQTGQPAQLSPLPIQYADYAIWQRQWLQGAVLETQLAYWKEQLAGAPTTLALPTDRPRPPAQTFRGAITTTQLPSHVITALQALSQREGTTLFMTLLAGFAVLLSRYTGQDDLLIGSPIAGRTRREIEPLIGFFVNTLVLRADLAGNPTVRALLERVRAMTLAAYSQQDLPFELLVEELRPSRDLSRSLLVQVMFALQSRPSGRIALPGLLLQPITLSSNSTAIDLGLAITERAGVFSGVVEYNVDLFDAATVARLLGHYQTVLAGIVADPERRLAELPLLTAQEQQQLLMEWNDTLREVRSQNSEFRRGQPVPDLLAPDTGLLNADDLLASDSGLLTSDFEVQAARTPDAVALDFEGQQLSYRALHGWANRLAQHLRVRGVGPEVRVGLCLERSLELVIGLLGVLKAGGAYVPLDPAYPAERLAFMLDDADVRVLLTRGGEAGGWRLEAGSQSPVSSLQSPVSRAVVDLRADWPQIAQQPATTPANGATPAHLAYIIYTSGSTGKPKGVLIAHRGVCNVIRYSISAFGIDADSRVLQVASMSFDASVLELFSALSSGARVCMVSPEHLGSGAALANFLRSQAITSVIAPPSFLDLLPMADYPTVRSIIVGAERCPAETMARWAPGRRFLNVYAPTEATIYATAWADADRDVDEPPLGRPIANMQVYLLDRWLQPTPIGVPGEIHLGGVGIARGYYRRPELTAQRFIPNPFANCKLQIADCRLDDTSICNLQSTICNRLYKTGDLARYLSDGTLEFLGRLDEQVKIRGFRIELGEIATVLEQHPSVRAAALLAREDTPGDKRLVAYIVTSDELRVTRSEDSSLVTRHSSLVAELRAFLKTKLPEYMIPNAFVPLEALPTTPSGKVDHKALPTPAAAAADDADTYVAPRTPTEEVLATIWAAVLERPHVGVEDSFFDLGGHSLLATRLIARAHAAFGVELSVRALFEHPTVRGLASVLDRSRHEALPPIAPATRPSELPLSFAQQRLWFLAQLAPESSGYHIPIALRLAGALDRAALRSSLDALIQRHEILRTHFTFVDGQPVQTIIPTLSVPLGQIDLCSLPEDAREPYAQQLLHAAAHQPFDLARSPLLRVLLVQLAGQKHLLLLTIHHIIFDAWSTGVLVREFSALYTAVVANQAAGLSPLPIQYADYAIWQRDWLQGAGDHTESPLQTQLAYWRSQLAGLMPLELPTDHARPPVQTFPGAVEQVALAPATHAALQSLSRQEGVTLFMTTLAAFQTLLARYSGQDDIAVGTPIANRTRVEIEPLIGFFVNTLVLRGDLAGNPTVRELLARMRALTLDAYAHQDVPFELLVDALQPVRDMSRTPLFQVMFTLQNAGQFTLEPPGLRIQLVAIDTVAAKFDLTLALLEAADGLHVQIEYNTDLFEPATILRLQQHFRILLEAFVADPARRTTDLPILADAERQQLLVEWNDTRREVRSQHSEFRRSRPVPDLLVPDTGLLNADSDLLASDSWLLTSAFEAQVAHTPDTIAIVFDGTTNDQRPPTNDTQDKQTRRQGDKEIQGRRTDNGSVFSVQPPRGYPAFSVQCLTYAALNARANQLAHELRGRGVGPDTLVALCAERSLEMIIGILGILKAGGAYVPLDPNYPRERLAFMLEDSQAAVLLTRGGEAGVWRLEAGSQSPVSSLQSPVSRAVVDLRADWPSIATHPHDNPPHTSLDAQRAYVIYTSGSTGRPKGVMVCQRGLLNLCDGLRAFFADPAVQHVGLITSISFDISVNQIFPTLLFGRTLHLVPEAVKLDGAALLSFVRAQRLQVLDGVPSYLHAVLQQLPPRRIASDLRYLLIGGERLERQLLKALFSQLGQAIVVVNIYGLTEITDINAFAVIRAADLEQPVTVGHPLQNNRIYLTDRQGQLVPIGVPGEVCIAGESVSRGYLNRAELSAEKFVPCPFEDGRVMCRTGDLGRRRPDGRIEILGRLDHQVKIRGYRIELGEIEAALQQHPSVQEVSVLARQDDSDEKRLVAYVVPTTDDRRPTTDDRSADKETRRQGDEADSNLLVSLSPGLMSQAPSIVRELRADLKQKLPEYMIPAAFVLLDALPRTPNGKIDRRALPAPEALPAIPDYTYVAPRTPIEEAVASLTAQVLGVDRVGVHDNFFDLGGHSLLATRLVVRLREVFAIGLPLRSLFETPTVAGLAEHVAALQWSAGGAGIARRSAAGAPGEALLDTLDLLSHLRSLGVSVWAEGDRLNYSAPKGVLTSELFAQLVAHKAEILAFLRKATTERQTPPPILPALRDRPLPLSFAQQRLWFLDQLSPGLANYNIPSLIHLSGQLDRAALQRSLNAIIARHEALRTTFTAIDGQPGQVIAPSAHLALAELDLRALPADQREAAAQREARAEAQRPFDLVRGPLVRASLVRLDETEYLALFTLHHIIADGWSIGVLVRELAAFYAASIGGRPASLPALPVQYADFAVWQREWLQGEVLRSQLDYWQQQLGDHLPALDLPMAHPRPPAQTFVGDTRSLTLGPSLTAALYTLSQREGVTLFMTLLAAFDILLYRYTGQTDIPIGSPIANRMRVEIEPLIGFFANTLVLRADLAGNPTVRELLGRVREVTLEAYAHQDLPFERLVEELRPERDRSRSPLFQAMLILQNVAVERLELPGLTLQPLRIDSGTAKFDIVLGMAENANGLFGTLEYNTDLFDQPAIDRLIAQFQTLLAGIVAAPDQPIGDLALLTAAERQQVLVDWNDTLRGVRGQGSGVSGCVHELFEQQARRTPDAIAVVFERPTTDDRRLTTDDIQDKETRRQGDKQVKGCGTDNGSASSLQPPASSLQQLTYRELDARANQLAHQLRSIGVGPDVRVGLCMDRSLELVIGVLGILKAGGAYVPLDPAYPAERLQFMLEDAAVRVLITQRSIYDLRFTIDDLEESQATIVNRKSKIVNIDADWPAIAQQPATTPASGAAAEHLAYVIYTSGSTGRPKGVAMPHRALANLLAWQLRSFMIAHPARTVQFASPSFDVSFQEIFSTWCSGGTLVVIAEDLRRDPAALVQFLNDNMIERLFLPFVALQQIAEVIGEQGLMPTHLREVITAGEQLRITQPIMSWLSDSAGCVLHNHYGPSESHVVTAFVLHGPPDEWPTLPPIGRPIANTQIYLLDTRMQPTPIGVPGELYIGGAELARGYIDRPDLTAERFIPNPFAATDDQQPTTDELSPSSVVGRPSSKSRLYRTGDLARYLDDGNIEFLGRADHQVKLRGYRIELSEVEANLEQHPAVREACAILREDAPGEKRLVAYVVPTREQGTGDRGQENLELATASLSPVTYHLSPTELREFLKERLPSYMVPAMIMPLAAWPVTPSGKVDRRALPAPEGIGGAQETYLAPRDTLELALTRIWEDLLGLAPIGVQDNFFELGGHSLLIVRLMARIQQQFGQRPPLAALFQEPSVEQLARTLRQAAGTSARPASPLVALQPAGSLPPFFCVHPGAGSVLCYVELSRQLGATQPFYGLQAVGLDEEQPPRTRVEAMAAAYLAAIRAVQPEGPYRLGGWSFGGLVAFELAQQLRAQGQQVALLALFDSWAPTPDNLPPEADEVALLMAFAHDLGRRYGREAPLSADELRRLAPEQRLEYLLGVARAAELLPPDIDAAQIERALAVFAANLQAMRSYQAQRYAGRVTLLRAGIPPQEELADPTLGWGGLAEQGVELQLVPGDHYSMVRPPQVAELAARLRACLDATQTEAPAEQPQAVPA